MTSARVTDPRNIQDKQFMNHSIRGLVDYLTKHGFEHQISTKTLTRPAVKDFQNIINFLFKQIDPNYASTGKFEDEVVAMFKNLGYPYQISKTNITAVGSPHAWPSLLASITWIIELLGYDEEAAIGNTNQDENELDDDPTASDKAFYSYLSKAYTLFLNGEDDKYAELEEQFIESYESKDRMIQSQIDALMQRNASLTKEIEEVEGRRAYLPELEARKRDYQRDLGKFQQLIEQLQKHKEQLLVKTQARQAELEKINFTVQTTQQEISGLKDRIAHQEISPEDVKRMISERERLEEAQQQASETRQALQRKVWETEMALRDRVQALEDTVRAYTSIAEDLRLVPHTARNARGKHLQIEIDVRAKKKDGVLKSEVKRDIIPTLTLLRTELAEQTARLRNELMVEQDAAEELELKSQELEELRAAAEAKLRRAEEAYRREKEAFDQAAEMHSKEMDAMETRLLRLRDTAAEEARITAANRRATEARAVRDARRLEHQRQKREIMESIMNVVAGCASHRELVEGQLSHVKDIYRQRLQSLLVGTQQQQPQQQKGLSVDDLRVEVQDDHNNNPTKEMSPIDTNKREREIENAPGSEVRSMDSDNADDGEVVANLSRFVPEPPRIIFNLNGALEQCARDELLDESIMSRL